MKQLLIANAGLASSGTGKNLSGLTTGQIMFFKLSDYSRITARVTENFGIGLGNINGQAARVIPEVDYKSLTVSKAAYEAHVDFSQIITVKYNEEQQHQDATDDTQEVPYIAPSPKVGDVFVIKLYKHGTVSHERNCWYFEYVVRQKDISTTGTTPMATTANNIAKAIKKLIEENASLGLNVTVSGAQLTLTSSEYEYTIEVSDNITIGTLTHYKRGTGTIDHLKDLAMQCAGDKGHFYTHSDSHDFIPGYLKDVPTSGTFDVYTLRFAVPRNSAKTRDEVVNQIVHIATPHADTGVLDTILGV